MAKGAGVRPSAEFSCTIGRDIRSPLTIDPDQIEEFGVIFQKIFEENIERCSDVNFKRYIADHGPAFEVKVTGGITYSLADTKEITQLRTSSSRVIESIELSGGQGDIRASLELNTRYGKNAYIRASGPEDRAEHFANRIGRICTETSDITTIVRKLHPFLFGVVSAILFSITIRSFFGNMVPHESRSGALWLVFIFTGLSSFVWTSVFEGIRDKLLPQVIFLWGEGANRHKIGKSASAAFLISFPLWIFGTIMQSNF